MNNREIASLAWIVIIFGYAILFKKNKLAVKQSIINILISIFSGKLFIIFSSIAIYISFEFYFLYTYDILNTHVYKESILWIPIAFSSAFKITSSDSYRSRFIGIIKSVFALSILIEYIANLYSFNLIAEFILTPILICLSMISILAQYHDEFKPAERFSQGILCIYILFIIIFSIVHAIHDPTINYHIEIRKLLIPFILMIFYMPFSYFFFLYCEHENIRALISCRTENKMLKNYVTLSVIKKFGINLFALEKWKARAPLYTIKTKDDIEKIVNTPATSYDS